MSNITTISFFKYTSTRQKLWAFGMMQFAHKALQKQPGLQWYKLMGSGKGMGFNPLPDWSTYSLLIVWENEYVASQFFQKSDLFQSYRTNATQNWTSYMKNISARGEWSKRKPFEPHNDLNDEIEELAVITRATIRWNKLIPFWKYVPKSEKPLHQNAGLVFTKGIGQVPILQMATFSIWKDKTALSAFAHHSTEHRTAIEKTKKIDWYSEELFARFQIFKDDGRAAWLRTLEEEKF